TTSSVPLSRCPPPENASRFRPPLEGVKGRSSIGGLMRTIDAGLAAHMAGGVTTLARCWVVARRDGAVLGFTDHDRDIPLDGVVCEAASGLSASEAAGESGFAAGGMEVAGALSSERLSEADLAAGLYDDAEVTVWLVNWQAPEERHLLRTGHIG